MTSVSVKPTSAKTWSIVLGLALFLSSCATRLPLLVERVTPSDSLAFGYIVVDQPALGRRIYPARLRFFELVNQDTAERFRIDVNAAEAEVTMKLPAGTYALSRLMISEGAFQALAAPGPTFRVEEGKANYVGTWLFDVRSPSYDRRVALVILNELESASARLRERYPDLSSPSIATQLPLPTESVSRMYETDPYPLIWWFRRHHTT